MSLINTQGNIMPVHFFANTTSLEGTLTLRQIETGESITVNGTDFTHEAGGEFGVPYLFIHHEQDDEDESKPEIKVFQDPDSGYTIEIPEGYEEEEDNLVIPSAFNKFDDDDD